jgi:hypothetical protein
MAKAPDPNKLARKKQKAASDGVVFRITIDGETHSLDMSRLGPGDDVLIARDTGLSLAWLTDPEAEFGIGRLAVLWWLARRKNGEPKLSWTKAQGDFPAMADLDEESVLLEVVDREGNPIEKTEDADQGTEGPTDPEA